MDERAIRVLLVEDNAEDVRKLEELAVAVPGARFEVTSVQTLQEAFQRLKKATFEAVLLDLSLSDSRGLETFQALYQQVPDMAIVVLTGRDDQDAIDAVKSGAQDSLVKGELTPSLLGRSVRYAIERHWIRSVMRSLLFIDELTGLYNRRGFSTLAEQHLKLARRTKKELLFIFVDLDDLKRINDTQGHARGDLALKKAAEVLQGTFRGSDIIARAGGDEFCILAIDAPDNSIEAIQSRLQENLTRVNASPEPRLELSLSYGFSHYHPQDTSTVQELLDQADAAMYQHKLHKHRMSPG